MKMTCVITDDEPVARKGLQSYVEKVDFLTLGGVCEDAIQLNNLLKEQRPDLLLLDIQMPYLSGLDLLATLDRAPMVVITSAYPEYALKGYELEVADYLLKPISFDRFLKAVNRVHARFEKEAAFHLPDEYLFVRSDKQLIKVYLKNILFVEGLENYVSFYTDTGKIVTHASLKHVQASLPPTLFLPVHRSYLVNVGRVDRIEGNQVVIGGHKIPVARALRDVVMQRILTQTL